MKIQITVLALVGLVGCGSNGPSMPTEPGGTEPPVVPFDMLDFMLNRSDTAYAFASGWALPTFEVAPGRFVECKHSASSCHHHEAFEYDGSMISLVEDHSLHQPWWVYTLGPWAPRFWKPGDGIQADAEGSWFSDGSCRQNVSGHSFPYTMTFEELTWHDFGEDLGLAEAAVVTYAPSRGAALLLAAGRGKVETNVYVRGVGRVYWSDTGEDWRDGPFRNRAVPKSLWNPAEADTCAWR